MFQTSQHGRADGSQILLQPTPILARELRVEHISRVGNDVYQAQRPSDVSRAKKQD